MRDAFAKEITELGRDPRVVLLSGDIGNRMFDQFKEKYPDRFYNCGVAEANMIGLAAGMAMTGLKPVVYTINSFITARCYEQIRVDLCYHNTSVVLVGVGAGLCYASLGATHHSCEDIAVMRVLPGMKVLCPGDAMEVHALTRQALSAPGPTFIRLGKKGEAVVHEKVPDIKIGKAFVLKPGSQVCLLSTGNVLPLVVQVSRELEKKGISAEVVSMHTVKPLDAQFLEKAFSHFAIVATIEEHSIIGGFGSAVAEWLSTAFRPKAILMRFGTPDEFLHEAGEQDHARSVFKLTSSSISESIIGRLLSQAES